MRKSGKKRIWLTITPVCIGILVISWISIERTNRAQEELVNFFGEIKMGHTRKELENLFRERRFKYLRMHHPMENESLVRTPLQWGATNWLLWIEFVDRRVAAAMIRYQDNKHRHPDEAPPDKVSR